MAIGFDYGTANCSVAQVINNNVTPITLDEGEKYITSTLSAPNRESVSEYLFRHQNILPASKEGETLLRTSINTNKQEGINTNRFF